MIRITLLATALLVCISPATVAANSADESTAQEAGNSAAKSDDPDDQIKCRSISITGSLARKERVCKTVGEWRRLRERGNDVARDIVDYSRSRPGGQ